MSKPNHVSVTLHIRHGGVLKPTLHHYDANESRRHNEFWVLRIDDVVSISFDSAEQLLAFDEACHGDIEDALFRHAHGVSEEVAEIASEQEGA